MTLAKTYGLKDCANCGIEFHARRINMIYCNEECCKEATNAKLIAKYHENKAIKNNVRKCITCDYKLSKYNPDVECYGCQRKSEAIKRKEVLNRLGIEYIDEEI